jgi:dipeptidyl aminopeptidase/acylaminoacyl peptidase
MAYGTWESPVTAEIATAGVASPSWVVTAGDEIWWAEPRPAEGGRQTLVRRSADGTISCPLEAPWDVRSRVIEYGAPPYAVASDDSGVLVVFVNAADQRMYVFRPDDSAPPRPLTPVSAIGGGLRWGELEVAGDVVRCVLEEFTGDGPSDLRRLLAAVPLDGSAADDRGRVVELSDDSDRFVSAPRYSPDGTHVVWLAWNHPHMPWDAAELKVASLGADGVFEKSRTLTGGPGAAVAQAEWAADGTLLAVCEFGDWPNLYRIDLDTGAETALHPTDEAFAGLPGLGGRWFAPLADGSVAVLHGVGSLQLGVLSGDGLLDVVDARPDWRSLRSASGPVVVGVAGAPTTPCEVVMVDLDSGESTVISGGAELPVATDYLPVPEFRSFDGPAGQVFADVYPPQHPEHDTRAGTPPYVVWAHGGPVSGMATGLSLERAYFTSRGIGVVEVAYGGTTGYGRAYRNRIDGQWGVVDVEDCAAVARALIDEGTADPARLAIRGASAGGFTAALSLETTDLYACATLLVPVLDLLTLAAGGTHDFESHFLDSLLGPFDEDLYRSRAPLTFAAELRRPFLLMQGAEDPVCPPAQSDAFLSRTTAPHTHLVFEGEGHGFRRASSLVKALEAELALYTSTFRGA